MSRLLQHLTREAVLQALDLYADLGHDAFLQRFGFGAARSYFVIDPRDGTLADSKAIAGVAHGFARPDLGPLKPGDFSGGGQTVAHLLQSLGFEMQHVDAGSRRQAPTPREPARDWTARENELLVADHLRMLTMQLNGQSFNKSAHRRALQALLDRRSHASIEFKHRNVSAVMQTLGFPTLQGYLPASHAQMRALTAVVERQTAALRLLDDAATHAVDSPAVVPDAVDFAAARTSRPSLRAADAMEADPPLREFRAMRRDYLEREARNRSLGAAGEAFIVQFERWKLADAGLGQLADRVRHVARDDGDGAGYDVRSFDFDGRERFIEVKTTAFAQQTPFFVSAAELEFSQRYAPQYRLARVYGFRQTPRFFELDGPVEHHCRLDPATFRAQLR